MVSSAKSGTYCASLCVSSFSGSKLFSSEKKMSCLGKESEIKKTLRNLCRSNGWSYGVFWRFNRRNSMLLTVEDAYCEQYAKSVTDDILLQVHLLGDGVIGQAALDGNHRWVYSDSSIGKRGFSTAHFQIREDNSDFSCEFSSGIKTIAVIPLESCGVLQFGSLLEILESPGFVVRTRQIFQETSIFDGLVPSGNATSSLFTDNVDQSRQFAPLNNYLPSAHSGAFEFRSNVSSCADLISATNNSIPSSSYLDNQMKFSGFNPLSLHRGSVDNHCLESSFLTPSNLHGFDEFNSAEFPTPCDGDILQWLYSSEPTLNDDLLQALVADLPTIPSQSSDLPSSNIDLLSNGIHTHFGNVKKEQTMEDLFAPVVDSKNTSVIQGVAELKDASTMVPKRGLFSELGLDQLLSNSAGSSSFAKSSIEDPISAPKKRRLECFPESGNQTNLASHPLKNFMMKSHVGLWAEDSFTADVKSCVTDQTKRSEESSKATKKRARPGESTRPRPKDRQMIQDRIKELREIIPNGGKVSNAAKCSIDSLLDRTIKHMFFMQGVTKYVDKLKRADEAKSRRNNSTNGGMSSSAAWAVEVGGQNPIIVEDLGHSGQMLIEMVCEEQGFFLEIADLIRSFGLTILKGEMEARDDKLWAHFIVEANRQVTRVEVLMSLIQLLKDTAKTGLKSAADGNRVLGNYHHQPMVSLPIGFADAIL